MSATLPEVKAGPIFLNFIPDKVVEFNCSEVLEGTLSFFWLNETEQKRIIRVKVKREDFMQIGFGLFFVDRYLVIQIY